MFSLSGFDNLSKKITNQWEFKIKFNFFVERKQSAVPLSES